MALAISGCQRVHFSTLQPFLLTTCGNIRRLEDIVGDKWNSETRLVHVWFLFKAFPYTVSEVQAAYLYVACIK